MKLVNPVSDPRELPYRFNGQISRHVTDDEDDLLGSIQKRLEFVGTNLQKSSGSIPDQLENLEEAGRLLAETVHMLQAYLKIVSTIHDPLACQSSEH